MKKGRVLLVVTLCIILQLPNSIIIYAEDGLKENTELISEEEVDPEPNPIEVEPVIEEKPEEIYIPATDLDISSFMEEMEVGDKQLLSIMVLPLNATNQTIAYVSSKPSIAEINELGRITAIKVGTTEISMIAADGIAEKFSLRVNGPQSTYVGVSDLDLGEYKTEIYIEETQLISPMTLPYNATVKYTSSDKKVASVNGFGKITGLTVGKTTIKAYVGGIERIFELKVLAKKDTHVKDIDLGDYLGKMEVGDSQLLYPAVLPVDAINPGFVYHSKNEKIATVNGLGRVTALAEGSTEITIKSDSIVKVIKLTVNKKLDIKITELDLGDFPTSMKVGESRIINPAVLPYEASGRVIKFESLNTQLATVSSFGRIKALAIGTVQIVIDCCWCLYFC